MASSSGLRISAAGVRVCARTYVNTYYPYASTRAFP